MKASIILLFLFFCGTLAAQKYIDVEIRSGNKVYIDYGEGYEGGGLGTIQSAHKDDGTNFKGPVDVIMYFEDRGYTLVYWSAYTALSVPIRAYLFELDVHQSVHQEENPEIKKPE